MSTQQMSATEALDFPSPCTTRCRLSSPAEASCEAYRIFTARRWRAQGYAVRKGEQGTAITTWIATPSREGRRRRQAGSASERVFVFCRHQVDRARSPHGQEGTGTGCCRPVPSWSFRISLAN